MFQKIFQINAVLLNLLFMKESWNHGFHKNLKQHLKVFSKFLMKNKCFLSTKSAY